MYVCICNAVTEKQIRRAKAAGIDNLPDLEASLGVATGCGCCRDVAESILCDNDSGYSHAKPALYHSAA